MQRPSLHNQLCLQRARLDGLQDRDDTRRLQADLFKPLTSVAIVPPTIAMGPPLARHRYGFQKKLRPPARMATAANFR